MGQTVTEERMNDKIAGVYYINAGQAVVAQNRIYVEGHEQELNLVTICIIILKNGFKVEGVSACVDPANYDEQKGQEYAYENAYEKLWQLEGYLLKEEMSKQ